MGSERTYAFSTRLKGPDQGGFVEIFGSNRVPALRTKNAESLCGKSGRVSGKLAEKVVGTHVAFAAKNVRKPYLWTLWPCLRKTLWKACLCPAKPWNLTYSALFSASFSANTTCVFTAVTTNPPEFPQSLSANTTRVATHVSALLCCSLSGPKDVESPLARLFVKPPKMWENSLGMPHVKDPSSSYPKLTHATGFSILRL